MLVSYCGFHDAIAVRSVAMSDDVIWMRRALQLAAHGLGLVEPNPMVGAVVILDGEVMGEGYHERFGGPHAEVNALAACRSRGVDPRGATVVVTLEPCCHTGKTGPCTEALIAAGVGRVVVAMVDPDGRVSGGGIRRLREAGVEVEVGVCEPEARRLNEAFIKRITTGRPWVIAKWAATLDGRTATANGHSQWISNEQSRAVVHQLRGRVDAIMVGVGTAIADDPSLTARPPEGSETAGDSTSFEIKRVARRLVIDRSRQMPAGAKMFHDNGPPVSILRGPINEELERLAAEGVTNVLVEGGATLLGVMFATGLVDQIIAFVAPKLFGDADALPTLQGLRCDLMDDAIGLKLIDVRRLGDDVMLDYRVTASSA